MSVTIDYNQFLRDISESGESVLLHIVPIDGIIHPVKSQPSVLFIRTLKTQKTITICFSHHDCISTIPYEKVLFDLSSISNTKWTFDKKSFMQLFPVKNLYDINLYLHLWEGRTIDIHKHQTVAHKFVYRSNKNFDNLNLVVPLLKHKEMFESLCNEFTDEQYPIDDGYIKENSIVVETLAELESNGIYVNPTIFNSHFNARIYDGNFVYSQYHIYTSTGRPSNNFDNVNYAALNNDNGVRAGFSSRYGSDGKMILIDYSAFHPRILCHLIKFPLSIDTDIYRYLGEMYFNRPITDDDIEQSKKLTFRQLYGGVEERYEHIKYFARLKHFIDENWKNFNSDGYVLTPIFKRRITDKHVLDPNPNKLFNYILQATETEVSIPVINAINIYLQGHKTKTVLYTYDSLLFDFHKDDGVDTLKDIITIMKMNNRFPIKVFGGETYNEVSQINL